MLHMSQLYQCKHCNRWYICDKRQCCLLSFTSVTSVTSVTPFTHCTHWSICTLCTIVSSVSVVSSVPYVPIVPYVPYNIAYNYNKRYVRYRPSQKCPPDAQKCSRIDANISYILTLPLKIIAQW